MAINFRSLKLCITTLTIVLLSVFTGQAQTLYWVGGQGEWSDVNHWATTSGGSIHPSSPPLMTENVYFDDNSFSDGDTVFVYNTNAVSNNMIWNTTKAVTFFATKPVNVYGNLELATTMTNFLSGGLFFSSTSTGKTITTNNVEIAGPVFFDGIGGAWTLQGALNVFFQISLNAGTLITNGYPVSCMHFYSVTNFSRTLNIGNSVFTIYLQSPSGGFSWNIENSPTFNLIKGGNSQINFTSGQLARMRAGDNLSYDHVTFYGSGTLHTTNSNFKNMAFGLLKTVNASNFYFGNIGESASLAYRNTFNNITFYDHGTISGYRNTVSQITEFRGNGNVLRGSNNLGQLNQYRYYGYMGSTNPNTLTLQSDSTQTMSSLSLVGAILCQHTIITSNNASTGIHANIFTPNAIWLQYTDLRYIRGKNNADPNAIGIAPDTALNSLNTNNINWVFPDNYKIPVIDSIQVTDVWPCYDNLSGQIKVFASGGMTGSKLQYSLSGPVSFTWQDNSLFTNLPKGTYQVQIRESRGTAPNTLICFTSAFTQAIVNGPKAITVPSVSIINPTCADSCNASMTIHARGGTKPLRYSKNWNFATGTGTFQTDSTFRNLCAGTYSNIMVRDANGCYYNGPQIVKTITAPPLIVLGAVSSTNITCNGLTDGTINLSASGGTGALAFTLNPGGVSNGSGIFNGLSANTYTITVTDANSCPKYSNPIPIIDPPLLQISTEIAFPVSCNNGADGRIEVQATGGTGQLTYKLMPTGTTNSSGIFTGLSAGSYYVIVTDVNLCTVTGSTLTVPNPPLIQITSSSSTDISCYNQNDGSITIQASGGTGSLNYTLNPSAISSSTGNFTNLAAGSYTVVILDENNCSITSPPLTISNPSAIILTSIQDSVNCPGGNDGCAIIQAGGGIPPYSYLWNSVTPNVANDTMCDLTAGVYTVVVTDANNCSTNGFVQVLQPNPLVIEFSSGAFANPSPPPDYLYFASASPSGGTGPYTHLWETGATTVMITNLPEGVYTDTITDANGCRIYDSVFLQALDCQIVAFRNVLCNGGNSGWALASGIGGNTPYQYSWRRVGNATVIGNNAFINNLSVGDYEVTITDDNLISSICSVSITEPSELIVSIVATPPLCFGGTGNLLGNATGGTPWLSSTRPRPYNYLWNNLQTTPSINVTAGNYQLIVTDSLGCTDTMSVLLSQPPQLIVQNLNVTQISCNGFNDGQVQCISNGGSGTISYTLNPGGVVNTSGIFTNLSPGTYSIDLKDINNCSTTSNAFTIINPPALSINSTTITQISCNGFNNGSIQINGSGGTGQLNYTLNPGGVINQSGLFSNLAPGDYTISISDQNTCTITSTTITIIDPPAISISTSTSNNISCNNANDGSISIQASGGTGTISYTLIPGNITNTTGLFNGLSAGTYQVTITDANSCTLNSGNFIITNPSAITIISASSGNMSCHNTVDGSINITAGGGTGTLTYTILPNNITNLNGQFTGLNAGTYTIEIKDANLCTLSSQPFIIINPEVITITGQNSTDLSCFNSNNGTITVTASGGTSPLQYFLNPGNVLSTTGVYTNLLPGSYSVIVTDVNNCPFASTPTMTIANPPALVINSENFNQISCRNAADGSISVGASGGTGALSYTLNPGNIVNSTGNFSGLSAGTYSVTVSDANNCQITSNNFILINPSAVSITNINQVNPTCFGFTNGSISILASGGTGILQYSIDGGTTYQTSSTFNNLPVGFYNIYVKDANDCIGVYNLNPIQLTQPTLLNLGFSSINPSCSGCSDGQIIAIPGGGTTPYSHSWNTGASTSLITGLTAGIYYVDTLRDANLCMVIDSIMLTEPDVFTHTIDSTNISCPGGSNGNITIHVSGGNKPYLYQWKKLPSAAIIGTDSTIVNQSSGTYTIQVTDALGYILRDTITLTQPSAFLVSFVTSSDSVCPGTNNAWITANVSGGTPGYSYNWSSGTGTPARPDSIFNLTAGTYNLSITDLNGCLFNASASIYNYTNPAASFSVNNACLGNPTIFNNTSTSTNANIITWTYQFGNGDFVTVNAPQNPNVSYIYPLPGIYSASLTVTDSHGCSSPVFTQIVTVNSIPAATFTFDTVCFLTSTQFTDQSNTTAGSITSRFWDFGDGTSMLQNPQHIFSSFGLQSVQLKVTDNIGCTDSITRIVLVDTLPQANFSYTDNCTGNTVNFTDLSQANATSILSWNWNFGDGYSSTLQNPQHTYVNFSIPYNVSLSVTNSNGCTHQITQSVQPGTPIGANFTFNIPCLGGLTQFNATSNLSSGNIQSVNWYFGDGNSGSGINPTHTYSSAGIYNVTMIMTSTLGCTQSISKLVTVNPNPLSNFMANAVCLGNTTQFTDLSFSPLSTINQWLWDFGNGNTSTLQHPGFTFTTSGTHPVSLQVWDVNGCTALSTQNITVNPLPLASFSSENSCSGAPTHFTDNSLANGGIINQWLWDFGDGNFSSLQNPSHTFVTNGSYPVTLQVWNSNSCSDDSTIMITVNPIPIADFTFDTACVGSTTSFTDQSQGVSAGLSSWNWSFGDGSTSVLQNPTHTYTSPGLYNVRLLVGNLLGCVDSIVYSVPTNPLPTAQFTYSQACLGQTTYFTDLSNGNGSSIQSWLWNFGDGNTSTQQNPTHQFLLPGTYLTSLSVTNSNRCQHITTMAVIVDAAPTASFTHTPPCLGTPTIFTDQSTTGSGSITQWTWIIDGSWTSNLQNPVFSFISAGNHSVSLIVQNSNGCNDTLTEIIFVEEYPVAAFTWSAGCAGLPVQFTDLSDSTGTTITDWLWNFDDGSSSTVQNPLHTYTQGGIYNVSLIVTKPGGCSNSISIPVTVDSIPVANFTHDTACSGLPTQFTDVSQVYGSAIASWTWDFGDPSTGINNSSDLQNPIHFFSNPGIFTVQLVVENMNGCTDTILKTINIFPGPLADFDFDTACFGSPTHFTDLTTSTGNISSWSWNFGAGLTSSVQNPTQILPIAGNNTVSLSILNINGCTASTTKTVLVDQIPVAGFSWSNPCNSNVVNFTDTSLSTTSVISSWLWDFGDGNFSSNQNPVHIYAVNQTYTISLTVSTSSGCSSTVSHSINVSSPFTVDFVWDTVCKGEPTHFTPILPTGLTANTYFWNFGDGNSSTTTNPSHQYALAGLYNVMMSITDAAGCSYGKNHIVTVNSLPQSIFTYQASCVDSSVQFTDLTPGSISARLWRFGDGNTSTIQNPTHSYALAGTYQVWLIITNAAGCSDSSMQTIVVFERPVAAFSASTACLNTATQFTDLSTTANGTLVGWQWDFGDGNTSLAQNPSHTYITPGAKNVRLVVSNSSGCSDTIIQTIQVNPLPIAGFTNTTACYGQSTQFTDTSTSGNGSITSWFWNFGNGNSSTIQNPQFTYSTAGNYTVSLSIQDITGCLSITTKTITVNPLPISNFTFSNNDCGNSPVQFTDMSNGNGSTITTWLWDFGDGNTSAIQNPSHQFSTTGNYTVSLTVTNANTCSNTSTKSVFIQEAPIAAFSVSNTCTNQIAQFTDQSTTTVGSIIQWNWNFGDPGSGLYNTSILQNPTHSFTGPGIYNVRLIITSSSLCKDTLIIPVSIFQGPLAEFNFTSACAGDTTYFTDNSTGNAAAVVSWSWNFGDGNSSTLQNPKHRYANSGNYSVNLVVTDANGCTSVKNRQVVVNPLPSPLFQFSGNCVGQPTFFSDFSNGSGASITTWGWDFGDPSSGVLNYSGIQNPSHIYNVAGTYTVTLTIINANGCQNVTTQALVIIPAPIANFTFASTCAGQPVNFTNTSTSNGGTLNSFFWDFGDGSTSTLQFPVHTFVNPGIYQVSLTVSNTNGCVANVVKPVTIDPVPSANFDYLRPNCFGDTTYFVNLTSATSGSGLTYLWDFGDGNSSTLKNPRHLYTNSGTYQVTLVVQSSNGCQGSKTKSVKVNASPISGFVYSNITCSQLQFSGNSYDPDTTITAWYWNFGDPGSGINNTSSIQNPQHNFSQAGVFNVQLMTVNAYGCSSSINQSVTISMPAADFSIGSGSNCIGNPVQFNDLSSGSGSTINQWLWNFGDGTTSTQQNPAHTYLNGGNYLVTLTVWTVSGCQGSITKPISIQYGPQSNFTYSYPNCIGGAVQFNDVSVSATGAAIVSRSWDFGDGTFSTLPNPVHTYNFASTYQVQLNVTDTNGCSSTILKPIKIYPGPDALFSYAMSNCTSAQFTDQSTDPDTTITGWLWNFGDPTSGPNNISNLKNPVHQFTSAGSYQVRLIAYNSLGCQDTTYQTIVINAPLANFTATSPCLSNPVQFTSTSTSAGSPIVSWNWQFGDGGTSMVQNPTHIYQNAGSYQVALLVTSAAGCQASVIKTITIKPKPTANFQFDTPCRGDSTHFYDLSMGAGNAIINNWLWDFGDGSTSNIKNPAHKYLLAGIYNVSLQVSDVNGCMDDTLMQVTVFAKPLANFVSNTVNCDTTYFTNTSSAGTGANIVLSRWNFGDPGSGIFNTSTQTNPWHVFTLPNTYNVRLIVSNNYGCRDTITKQVLYDPFPQPDFTFDTACSGYPTSFTALNTAPNITGYQWTFGDGFTGVGANPQHTYANPGIYNVTLVITNSDLCTNHITKQVLVKASPIVNFTINGPACSSSPVNFTNQSTGNSGIISTYLWDFGDGTTSVLIHPSHLYAAPGTFNVTLTTTNTNGCFASITKPVIVNPGPSVDFTNDTVCLGLPTSFVSLATPNTQSLNYWHWNFGDGQNLIGILNPTHVFATSGIFNVTHTVRDIAGCEASIIKPVEVYPLPQAAFATSADTLCHQDTVYFVDQSIAPAGIASWTWYFGEPSSGAADTSHLQNPSHRYANQGTYYITLIITDNNGCQHQTTDSIVIQPLPVVNFNYTVSCANDTTFFTDLSYVTGGQISSYLWDFGDGTTSTLKNPFHIYGSTTNDTIYQVTLTATSNLGCSQIKTRPVPVWAPPVADFSFQSACQGSMINFTNLSTSPSGFIVSWAWDFGDSTYSGLPNPFHLYDTAGTYNVQLIVASSNGCYDTIVKPVTVFALPTVMFSADTVCFGDSTHFTDLSSIPGAIIETWTWNFGDPFSGAANTSSLQNPAHLYTVAGTFNVSLYVTDTNGCIGNITQTVKVNSLPLPAFTYTAATCQNTAIAFNDESTSPDGGIMWWNWNFGDGTDTIVFAPANPDLNHIYTSQGQFQVTLIVADSNGCIDSISHYLTIWPVPEAGFTWSDSACTAGVIYFNDTSVSSGGNISSWFWDFEYPNQYWSPLQNPVHYYPHSDSTYVVMLTIEDIHGCRDTVFDTIYVSPGFTVDFNLQSTCFSDTANFTPVVISGPGDSIVSVLWTFGDGSTSTQINATHVYPNPGLYYVQLKAWNKYGCEAFIVKPITIQSLPEVVFTAPPAGCNDSTVFTDQSIPNAASIVSWHWYFGDGSDSLILAPSSPDVWHHYPPEGGIYTATLIVTNSNGCIDSLQQEVVRFSCLSTAFEAPIVLCSGKDAMFIDLTNTGSPAVSITSWNWEFGDGQSLNYTAKRDTIYHNYAQSGWYDVRLIVQALVGTTIKSDTASQKLRVFVSPNADFTFTAPCDGLKVTFKDISTIDSGNIVQWNWDFDDGGNSALQHPTHTFSGLSGFDVQMIATSDNGCADTAVHLLETHSVPPVMLSAPDSVFCGNTLAITFKDLSNVQHSQYVWDFGDGTVLTNNSDSATHVFEFGEYAVSLTVKTAENCKNSDTLNIILNPQPYPAFSFFPDSIGVLDGKVAFVDESLSSGASLESWKWLFGDGRDTLARNPIHTYRDTGFHKVYLIVTDLNGCADTAMRTVRVFPELAFFVPNAFSPNGDNKNNIFKPKGAYFQKKTYLMQIFNRWGQLVFETTDYNQGWDGKTAGLDNPVGVYVWVISLRDMYNDKEVYKGSVVLIR